MKNYLTLNHTKWDCKYHVVFIPKRRKKVLYGGLRKEIGKMLHAFAAQKECGYEGHLKPDHVHMCIQIPPKFAVSNVIGYLKGKSAIAIARDVINRKKIQRREFLGERLLCYHSGNR